MTATDDPLGWLRREYLKGFIAYMEGICASPDCHSPVEWEIAAVLACCHRTDTYCRSCGRAQWYQSGMFGKRCPDHNILSQTIYHPRKIGGSGKCMTCPDMATCPVWDRPVRP